MLISQTNKKISSALIILFMLAAGIVLPVTPPKKAQADVPSLDLTNLAQTTISAAQSVIQTAKDTLIAADTHSLWFKEYVLDWVANTAAKILIKTMSQSIVNWIKGGDSRGSLFIENFLEHFIREMDNKVGVFLEKYFGKNSKFLGLLCEPFRLTIPPLIKVRSRTEDYGERARCKLSDIVRNVENFNVQIYFDDFSHGGWDAWFASFDPSGNSIGQYLMGASKQDVVRANALINSRTEVETTGGGLLSWQKCDEVPASDPYDETGNGVTGETYKTNCRTQTPGGVVQDLLKSSETSWIRQLEVADEINEIINVFFQTMLQKLSIPWDNTNSTVVPPSSRAVMITAPFDGLEVAGNLRVVATLNTIVATSTVQFTVDNLNIGGAIPMDKNGNFEYTFSTLELPNGEHSIIAILTGIDGNKIDESLPVRIRVNNP
ncbi:MAG: hypothetical protein HYT21_03360 [Candidatus Nealsonbacteria bacterium]|nr:hypothetical protein [Candidatus Nealsonbacteria bacterium]